MNRPEINVTPLIDVLLVLLIIFMVVTPMKPSSFKTKIPQERRQDDLKPLVNPETLIVSIDERSGLVLNREAGLGSVNDSGKLVDRLRQVFAQRIVNYGLSGSGDASITRHVFIRAPRGLDYGSVAKVVDAVKMSGADPIALQIDELN